MQIVFLPGMDGTGRLFEPLRSFWPKEWPAPMIIPYPPDKIMDYAQLQAYVEPRLPANVSWVLAAESFGGPLAARIAAKDPPGLVGLVLSATFVRKPRGRLGDWGLPFVRPGMFRNKLLTSFMRLMMRAQGLSKHQIDWLLSAIFESPSEVLVARMKEALKVEAFADLRHCHVPVLCLYAKQDLLLSRDCKELIDEANPKVELVGLDTPHFLLQTHPQEAMREIQHFVQKLTP